MDSHTLIQALIYLGSAALIVPIAVRLGLGSVLSSEAIRLSDCRLYYRAVGAEAGDRRRGDFALC